MPRRSRGCLQCRQKRIGCDGTLPSCRQCLLYNRPCSGSVQGLLVIDQTRSITSRHGRSRKASLPSDESRSRAMTMQPPSDAMVSMAFVSRFVSFLTSMTEGSSRRSWLHILSDTPLGKSRPVLDLSLEAVGTAFYGVTSRTHGALVKARQIYGDAITQQSSAISETAGSSGSSRVLISAMIRTSVILSLFEAIWPTNLGAYGMHLSACWKMLNQVDLEVRDNDVLKNVAAHIRIQMLFASIVSPSTNLHQMPWGVDVGTNKYPQAGNHSLMDRLVDELHRLQALLNDRFHTQEESMSHAKGIEKSIDALSVEFQKQALQQAKNNPPAIDNAEYTGLIQAMTEAYLSAARLLLQQLKLTFHDTPISSTSEKHGREILNCAMYLTSRSTSCAYLRMFSPLTLVGIHSQSAEQRAQARRILESWKQNALFWGLSSIALQRIQIQESNMQIK